LLGVGVSGLEEPDQRGIDYDTAAQKVLDKTKDEIRHRYGEGKATHAGTLRKGKQGQGKELAKTCSGPVFPGPDY